MNLYLTVLLLIPSFYVNEHPIYHPIFIPHASHQKHSDDGWYEYKEPLTLCPVGEVSVVCKETKR